MANELRILASLTVDLGTSDPQPIDMSAYGNYVVLGYAVNNLAETIPSGSTTLAVKNAAELALTSVALFSTMPTGGAGLAAITAGAQQAKVQPGGDLHVVVTQTLRPGNTAVLSVLGVELP